MSWMLLSQSDDLAFFGLQLAIAAFTLIAFATEQRRRSRAGENGATYQVIRSPASMGVFYGSYATATGLMAAICLSVDPAAGHRVFFTMLNTAQIAYVCLINGWFRNLLVNWSIKLAGIERG